LQDAGEFEVLARSLGHPELLHCAVRDVHEAEARLDGRLGICEGSAGRDHCIQQRQRDGDTRALQDRAAGKMLLGEEHDYLPPIEGESIDAVLRAGTGAAGARRRKASLLTTPITMDSNLSF